VLSSVESVYDTNLNSYLRSIVVVFWEQLQYRRDPGWGGGWSITEQSRNPLLSRCVEAPTLKALPSRRTFIQIEDTGPQLATSDYNHGGRPLSGREAGTHKVELVGCSGTLGVRWVAGV